MAGQGRKLRRLTVLGVVFGSFALLFLAAMALTTL